MDACLLVGFLRAIGKGGSQSYQSSSSIAWSVPPIELDPHHLLTALTGAYDGAGAIERAFADFKAGKATRTGIMVHYVVLEVDRGDPIMVQEIEWQGEELPQLEERVHSYEHELIVKATAKVAREILEER